MIFQKDFPWDQKNFSNSVLFFDQKLLKLSPDFKKWKKRFKFCVPLSAGEKLKSLESLRHVLNSLQKICSHQSPSDIHFVACGGGSVTDFVGFLASIYKRGVRLTFVPSTWLASIDSAHGGKTGLNFFNEKNQIGTFYSANEIYLVESLLSSQPPERGWEALSELVKIFLLTSPRNLKKLSLSLRPLRFVPGEILVKNKNKFNLRNTVLRNLLFKFLPVAIAAKMKIVKRDPYEKLGPRRVLNLGHTLGHVLESNLRVPHGVGVAEGIVFALKWSVSLGIMKLGVYQKLEAEVLDLLPKIPIKTRKLRLPQIKKSLLVDKKKTARDGVNFVFLKDIGHPQVKEVRIQQILTECQRQDWTP